MVCTNELGKAERIPVSSVSTLLQLLNPFAPHISSELSERLREKYGDQVPENLAYHPWPKYEEKYLVEDEIEMVIQVNGKVRDRMTVAAEASKEECEELAKQSEKVQGFIEGQTIRKVIVVPKKLVNIVAN